jgi:hypothetical protein
MDATELTCKGCGVAFCARPSPGRRRRFCTDDCKLRHDGARCRASHTTITVNGRAYARFTAAAAALGVTIADLVEAAVVPALPEVPC